MKSDMTAVMPFQVLLQYRSNVPGEISVRRRRHGRVNFSADHLHVEPQIEAGPRPVRGDDLGALADGESQTRAVAE